MTRTLVVFDDLEKWATDYLRALLADLGEAGVFVSNSLPATLADRMVIVRRDGGPRLDVVRERARLSVRVWALTKKDTHDLAALVRAGLEASADGRPVHRVSNLSGPSNVPLEHERPSILMSFDLITRGTARTL